MVKLVVEVAFVSEVFVRDERPVTVKVAELVVLAFVVVALSVVPLMVVALILVSAETPETVRAGATSVLPSKVKVVEVARVPAVEVYRMVLVPPKLVRRENGIVPTVSLRRMPKVDVATQRVLVPVVWRILPFVPEAYVPSKIAPVNERLPTTDRA
jgi:hypothetical protein